MPKLDYDFTQEECCRRVINAIRGEPAKQGKKPTALQGLLTKTKLGKKE